MKFPEETPQSKPTIGTSQFKLNVFATEKKNPMQSPERLKSPNTLKKGLDTGMANSLRLKLPKSPKMEMSQNRAYSPQAKITTERLSLEMMEKYCLSPKAVYERYANGEQMRTSLKWQRNGPLKSSG